MPDEQLSDDQRDLVVNLLHFFTAEFHNGGPILSLSSVQERTAAALGIGITSVKRIVKENRSKAPLAATPGTPQAGELALGTVVSGSSSGPSKDGTFKCKPRKKLKTDDLPHEMRTSIRDTIYEMYDQKKPVTLLNIVAELKQKVRMNISTHSLRRVLTLIGFEYRRVGKRLKLVGKREKKADESLS